MRIRGLDAIGLDLKWTAEPLRGEVGPHMDLTLVPEFLEAHVLSRAWSIRPF